MTPPDPSAVNWEEFARECDAVGLTTHLDHPLAGYTTYGVGGPARCVVVVAGSEEIRKVAAVFARHPRLEGLIIGKGSNLLVSDDGFDGVAIVLTMPASGDDVRCEGEIVEAPASLALPILARRCATLGRAGLEWAVGVPGTVGGAVRMNAGGHGSDMREAVVDCDIISLLSGREARVKVEDLGLHFRGSALAPHHLVMRARLRTGPGDRIRSMQTIESIVAWRREHQPGGRNAGSVFVNPDDGAVAAGALIDGCGLRGHRVGGAQVSNKHANFIQADGSARARDIVNLMCVVQDRVEDEHGVRLMSEIRLVGFEQSVLRRFSDPRHSDGRYVECARTLARLLGEAVDAP